MTVKPTDPYVWTKERCVNALLTFHAENGRTPYWDEFEKAPRWRYPHPNTIRNMFGSWGAAIRELGLPAAPYRSRWNKDRIVDAMLDHVLVAGRWPTCEDWTKPLDGGNDRPAKQTVLYHFGTWNEAKRCAGWDGRHPRARVEEYVEPRCEECGTEFENTVIGCKSCHERHRGRRRRLRSKSRDGRRLHEKKGDRLRPKEGSRMTGLTDEIAAFLRDEATTLDRLADSIDLAGQKQTNDTAKAYSDGAAFVLRNTAQAFRERIPTELHDHDSTPADLDVGVAA